MLVSKDMENTNNKSKDSKYILLFISIVTGVFMIFISISLFLYYAVFKDFDFVDFVDKALETNESSSSYVPTQPKSPLVKTVYTSTSNSTSNINESTSSAVVKTINVKAPNSITTTTTVVNNANVKTNEPTCYKYALGDPFNVTKCYLYDDYANLISAYNGYDGTDTRIGYIKKSIEITCDGSDFFKDSCDRNKDSLKDAENDKDEYEKEILSIIPRGK